MQPTTTRVLYVDGDVEGARTVAESLEGQRDGVRVDTVPDPGEAPERIGDEAIDCVVSAYDLGDTNGVELLRTTRERFGDVPFVLFTGEGDEAVASEAISAGVTEYVRRDTGAPPWPRLADAVESAVEGDAGGDSGFLPPERLSLHVEDSPFGVVEWNEDFELVRMNEAAERILGYEQSALEGRDWEFIVPEDDHDQVEDVVEELLEARGGYYSVNENVRGNGEVVVCEWHNRVVTDEDDEVVAVISQFRDVTDRRETHRKLRSTRQLLVESLNALEDLFYVVDTDGVVRTVNDRVCEVTGYAETEILGEDLTAFVPQEYAEQAVESVAEALETGESHLEAYIETKSGEEIPYEFRTRRLTGPDGETLGIAGIGRDVSDREARERELRQKEQRYRNLVENSPAPITLFDRDGTAVWGNDALLELLGLDSQEDIVDRSVFEVVHPDDHAFGQDEIAAVFEDGETVGPSSFRIVRDDGEQRYVQVMTTRGWYEGDPVAQAVVNDVTELRETQERLEQNERRYRTLVEMSPDPILVHSDGVVRFVNEAFLDVVAAEDEGAVLGTHITEFLAPSEHEDFRETARRTQRGEQAPTGYRRTMRTLDGEERFIATTSRPIAYEGESAVLTFVKDQTERIRYQRAVEALHEHTRAMLEYDDAGKIAASAVTAAEELLEFPGAAVFEFDEAANALVPLATSERTEAMLGADSRTGPDDDAPAWEAFVTGETRLIQDLGEGPGAGGTGRSGLFVPLGNHGVLAAPSGGGEGDGGELSELAVELCSTLAANLEAALDRLQHERRLGEQDLRLERQTSALSDLDYLNTTLRKVTRALMGATTRGSAEAAICERLGDEEDHSAVWIGRRRDGDDGVRPVAMGDSPAGLEDWLRDAAAGSPLQSVLDAALSSGSVQHVPAVLDDPTWAEERQAALKYGFRSVLAVPVPVRNDHDRVLVVHATASEAFTDRQMQAFGEIGELVGSVFGALGASEPQLARTETEVELRIDDDRLVLSRASNVLGGDLRLEGVFPVEDGRLVGFLAADCSAEAVTSLADSIGQVTSIEPLTEGESSRLYRLEGPMTPFVELVYEYGATIVSMTAVDGSTTVTVRVPGGGTVREFVDDVRALYPESELLAKRTVEDAADTAHTFREAVEQACTDRQFQALQAAHYGGFYEWPREATNEDLAEVLGIASPTYQSHRRAAERVLMAHFFDHTP